MGGFADRGNRGGSFFNGSIGLAASFRPIGDSPSYESYGLGFRVPMIPEPGTGLLVMTGILGLAAVRRRHSLR